MRLKKYLTHKCAAIGSKIWCYFFCSKNQKFWCILLCTSLLVDLHFGLTCAVDCRKIMQPIKYQPADPLPFPSVYLSSYCPRAQHYTKSSTLCPLLMSTARAAGPEAGDMIIYAPAAPVREDLCRLIQLKLCLASFPNGESSHNTFFYFLLHQCIKRDLIWYVKGDLHQY